MVANPTILDKLGGRDAFPNDLLQAKSTNTVTVLRIITKNLVASKFDIGESVDPIHSDINYSYFNSMKVHLFQGGLRNDSMDKVKDLFQPAVTNDDVINKLLEISQ